LEPELAHLYNAEKVITIILTGQCSHLREVKMRTSEYRPEQTDYYRSNAFPAVDPSAPGDDALLPEVHSNVKGKHTDDDPASNEREKQVEAWMKDIKAFIRNIDVSKL
jgi:hypothetical protein